MNVAFFKILMAFLASTYPGRIEDKKSLELYLTNQFSSNADLGVTLPGADANMADEIHSFVYGIPGDNIHSTTAVIKALQNLGIEQAELDKMNPIAKRALYESVKDLGSDKGLLQSFSVEDREELMSAIQQLKSKKPNETFLPSNLRKNDRDARLEEHARFLTEVNPNLSMKQAKARANQINNKARELFSGGCSMDDFIAILDASGSMGLAEKHVLGLQAVSQIMQGLGPQSVFVTRFSNYAETVFGPGTVESGAANAIENSRYMGGGTAMSTALQKVLAVLPSILSDENKKTDIMMTFSDFNVNSADRASTTALFSSIKEQFPELINWCIVIGTDGDVNYANTQCGPDKVLHYPDTDAFYRSIADILSRVCPAILETPNPTTQPRTEAPSSAPSTTKTPSVRTEIPTGSPTFNSTMPPEEDEGWGLPPPLWFRRRKVRKELTAEESEELRVYESELQAHLSAHEEYKVAKKEFDEKQAKYERDLAAYEQQQSAAASSAPAGPPPKHNMKGDAHERTTWERAGDTLFGRGNLTYKAKQLSGNIPEPHAATPLKSLPHPGQPPIEPKPPAPFDKKPPEAAEINTQWQFTFNPLATMYGVSGSSAEHQKIPVAPDAGLLTRAWSKLPAGRERIDGLPFSLRIPLLVGEVNRNDLKNSFARLKGVFINDKNKDKNTSSSSEIVTNPIMLNEMRQTKKPDIV